MHDLIDGRWFWLVGFVELIRKTNGKFNANQEIQRRFGVSFPVRDFGVDPIVFGQAVTPFRQFCIAQLVSICLASSLVLFFRRNMVQSIRRSQCNHG